MPTEVVMPRLGWDMQVGSIAEWLKRDGERVEAGEPICMIAGDKATTELEALDSGILRLSPRSPEPGVEVPVGTVLAYLVGPGEDIPDDASPPLPSPSQMPALVEDAAAAPANGGVRGEESQPRIVATPRARRAAAQLGVEWRTLAGTGRGGRIVERDVVHASASAAQSAPDVRPPSAGVMAQPIAGIRRLTAERMSLSARTVAPVTLTTEADATNLVRLREQARSEGESSDSLPGFTELLVKVVALALGEHPALNAELTPQGIVQHSEIHIAVAVDSETGLIAPVIRDAASQTVAAIARESRRLVEAARAGRSQPADLAGATFTISNLGMYDIDAFTPIVNVPQCAILGIGRIVARPVVLDEATETIAVRRILTLSLTFDHRLVDGAPAARFLQRIKHLVERPTLWLFR